MRRWLLNEFFLHTTIRVYPVFATILLVLAMLNGTSNCLCYLPVTLDIGVMIYHHADVKRILDT